MGARGGKGYIQPSTSSTDGTHQPPCWLALPTLPHAAAQVGPRFVGFFKPCDYLVQAARSGRKLEAGLPPASKM